jgi:hypothetical protein
MKIIEGLKQVKDLQKKADDLKVKIGNNSAHLSYEKPVYQNQAQQIKEWLQSHSDILKEILRLRIAIQKTNLATNVTIDLGDNNVTKSIAEWIHRRKDLAKQECAAWSKLTDRGLREGQMPQSTGDKLDVTIMRYYDPKERDNNVSLYDSEPSTIDAKLEIVNAVTDLIE